MICEFQGTRPISSSVGLLLRKGTAAAAVSRQSHTYYSQKIPIKREYLARVFHMHPEVMEYIREEFAQTLFSDGPDGPCSWKVRLVSGWLRLT